MADDTTLDITPDHTTHDITDDITDTTDETVDHDGPAEPREARAFRELMSRQLELGHDFGTELTDAITDMSVAVVHAPAAVVDGIRGGATLPTAVAHSGTALRESVTTAGESLRTAVGDYVGHQATLPNAFVVGASNVAQSVLRAQGRIATSAIDASFMVASVVVRGGDLQEVADRERQAVGAATDVARQEIGDSVDRSLEEIRGGVEELDGVRAE